MPFPLSPFTPQFLVSVERTVTRERLRRYLVATNQHLANALLLYEYNVGLSEIMYGLLHGLEVTVRNSIHHALTASYGAPTWYDHAPLSPYWLDQIVEAKQKIQTNMVVPGPAAPGKVIAELTFGFWVDLVSRSNHNTLWMGKKLSAAFPHATVQRDAIHLRLKAAQRLRNRISHHERIITSRNTLYTGDTDLNLPQLLECVQWTCANTAQWLQTRFRYDEAQRTLLAVTGTGVHL